ncbi:hypothetical protein ASPZODRAFT_154642 [Penicilliopsis zonata CBS 506.65]|uniref:ubiquitinyl hydrolase 1 n=1 Tax=Penicilliopsis zonata CBS 506.65 TaxID=1073090 RepID=A0A1L9S8H5_9EURO|nr:hypothetical protein ASPZODRAFT_154642 [Penicilliopsis zonata CBS 506.65]OJJ43460.1 hypothetical protein ASPZODRAFT_154642 [Penicilliopsis zonata CBS 506.65]
MPVSDIPFAHFGPYSYTPDRHYFPSTGQPQFAAPFSFLTHSIPQITLAFQQGRASSAYNMAALSPDEMERFQQLSNNFEPNVQGPLVTPKQSSHAIADEYANADPTYATKTSTLALTHPMSRIMKGDGNCGWRAVAFGYFENLFLLRDPLRVQRELIRLKSMNTLLDQVGQQEHLYEIFVDESEAVFNQILEAIQKGIQDDSFLVHAFNEEYNSNAIITHFRLLTSAWMRLNPGRYQAFLSLPLEQYCATRVETVKTEIDEVGLQALVDGVIEGSELAVEILYLDRSEGEVVTPHLLTPNRPSVGTIRLLYRPGHYDLLYRPEPIVTMAPVVNYQYGITSNYSPWDQGALSFDVDPHLMAIPNLMMDPAAFAVNPSPMSAPVSNSYRMSPPHDLYLQHTPPPVSIPSPPVVPRMSAPPPPMTSAPNRSSDGPQIRLNPLVMKNNLSHSLPVTTPFKNSPYNQAHFQNQDFEPIHWEPNESRK